MIMAVLAKKQPERLLNFLLFSLERNLYAEPVTSSGLRNSDEMVGGFTLPVDKEHLKQPTLCLRMLTVVSRIRCEYR